MRRKIIAGNWKMNKRPSEGAAFAREAAAGLEAYAGAADVIFCVPFTHIAAVTEAVKGTKIAVGAQNLHHLDSGAYTGEVSADMLVDAGVKYVIIGHSERRQYFGETDELVNIKTRKALEKGLIPIVCVGERLDQREKGITEELLRLQIKIAFKDIPAPNAEKVVVAYEPIWAIGTGVTATDEQAQKGCQIIRKVLSDVYAACGSPETAGKIRVQYGGSVTAATAAGLFGQTDIDGGLVGGASLTADFVKIVGAAV